MSVPHISPRWLLFLFSLPTSRASLRVEIWRRLQRLGAIALPSAGYVLPCDAAGRESFEWLAALIRTRGGRASVVEAGRFDLLSDEDLEGLFQKARARDYAALLRDLQSAGKKQARIPAAWLRRARKRFQDIAATDYFRCPLRVQAEEALRKAERADIQGGEITMPAKTLETYKGRIWVTRPRPGVDRVFSAWLIRRFIDPRARFRFANDPKFAPKAVPFDMYQPGGFSHRGDDCTFETLVKEFTIRDGKVRTLAQMVHDADIKDGKFDRPEGAGIDRVLKGWAQDGVSDSILLKRGMELVEGLYKSLS